MVISGARSDMNPARPDTSMKLGRCFHKHELFDIVLTCFMNESCFFVHVNAFPKK